MRYFKEIEISDVLPISEATDWIAFGNLPDASYILGSNDQPMEERENVGLILERDGHPFGSDLYLGKRYISEFFPEVDADAYVSAYEACGGQSPEEISEILQSWIDTTQRVFEKREISKDTETMRKSFEERNTELELELQEAARLRTLQAPIMHKVQAARAKLLMELINGGVAAKGVQMPSDESLVEDWDQDDFPTNFSDISPSDWNMEGIDWQKSNLTLWDKRYVGVIIPTLDLLARFPRPDTPTMNLTGFLFGGTFITDSEESGYVAPEVGLKKRGAPHRTDRILESAIHGHLDRLKEEDRLPTKKEAQLAEISDFVSMTLQQQISRSTAQRILARWSQGHAPKDAQK